MSAFKARPSATLERDLDEQWWMARALALARRGEALASPNPMVGAVLVGANGARLGRKDEVVGEGFHTYAKLHHAEILALEKAGPAARGATLYVNLEPCCHTGRTGPCTRAIIAAGVARVIAAMPDPNPAVAGRGFAELRAAGIEVTCGILEEEARRLNEAFACWITAHRPWVTLKSALTRDGEIFLAEPGKRRWITSAASRKEVQRMRHGSDALLTGIGTVLVDDPRLTDRTGLPRRRPLLRVILDSHLRLRPDSRPVRSARSDVLVFTTPAASSARASVLRRAGVEILPIPSHEGRPDLREVLAELARRDILSVLLEAGPALNDAALAAGLVDKVRLFYGSRSARRRASSARSGAKVASRRRPPDLATLSRMRLEEFGPDVVVEGYLHDVYEGHTVQSQAL
jgi:diaminohydroxyphosphoribosylaminopyrimidine deaminase/5-amino-6-(5-phosphoribosylamino)uracil reductase